MKKAHKAIAWSGGLDSTCILLKALDNQYFVDICIIDLKEADQYKTDKVLQKKLLPLIKSKYKQQITSVTKHKLNIYSVGSVAMSQPIIWMSLIPFLSDAPIFEFGYIRGDDFWHVRSELELIFINAIKLIRADYSNEFKVKFPIEWYTKHDIIDWYYKNKFTKEILNIIIKNSAKDKQAEMKGIISSFKHKP